MTNITLVYCVTCFTKEKKKLNLETGHVYNIIEEEKPKSAVFHFYIHHPFLYHFLNWCSQCCRPLYNYAFYNRSLDFILLIRILFSCPHCLPKSLAKLIIKYTSALIVYTEAVSEMKVAQFCLILCNSVDYAVHGIFQARILEWVAFPFSKGIFPTQGLNPGIPHCRQIFYQLATRNWLSMTFKSEMILNIIM